MFDSLFNWSGLPAAQERARVIGDPPEVSQLDRLRAAYNLGDEEGVSYLEKIVMERLKLAKQGKLTGKQLELSERPKGVNRIQPLKAIRLQSDLSGTMFELIPGVKLIEGGAALMNGIANLFGVRLNLLNARFTT